MQHSLLTDSTDSRYSGESVESSVTVQRDALCSSELFSNVIKCATFRLREANPSEDEGEQSHGHEEEVDIHTTDFLCVGQTDRNICYLTFL